MTLEELAAKWEASAQHQRRTAKQQRTACREGNSAKVRLLALAVQAEEHARELRTAAAGKAPVGSNSAADQNAAIREFNAKNARRPLSGGNAPQPTVDNREPLDVDGGGPPPIPPRPHFLTGMSFGQARPLSEDEATKYGVVSDPVQTTPSYTASKDGTNEQ